jgi:hypothetical protein
VELAGEGIPKPRRVTTGAFAEDEPLVVAGRPADLLHLEPGEEPYYSRPDANVYSVPAAAARR